MSAKGGFKIVEQEDIDSIIKMYVEDRLSTSAIGSKFLVSDSTISSLLKREGINVTRRRSKTNIDSNYFKEIDSQEKAYFFGLILSDGLITKTSRGTDSFSLSLDVRDSYILNELSVSLCGTSKLVSCKDRSAKGLKGVATIKFSDKIFTDHLLRHAALEGQPFRTKMPELSDDLMHHFIRGYFDGDGCVYLKRESVMGFSFSGSWLYVPFIRDHLYSIGLFQTEYKIIDRGIFCSFHFSKRALTLEFYNYLYLDSTIHMHNKKSIFGVLDGDV